MLARARTDFARDSVAVTDGTTGRSAAGVEGIETRGTASAVLAAVRRGDLSPEDGRETINATVDADWYVAPDVYTKIVGTLESLGD